MTLSPGQTLSFYEVLGSLGAGGMGEVYRARDTRLDREVAIKVLPEAFVADAERLQRFEREARTLASLNHPNVGAIHGIDESGEVHFLALELVPGEDLSERIARSAMPIGEALELHRQIAEGLEAAHAAGVVHRDLKPANVRITPDGKAKVLDFGLAKPSEAGPRDDVVTTEAGRLLGTPAYMSPEQARGRPVDSRSDVWAFGCLLFESLSGRCAFEGDTLTDVLVAVAEKDPDWSVLPSTTPVAVRHLLERCLQKDARARLQAVGEARIVLEDPNAPGVGQGAAPGPVRSRAARLGVSIAMLALAGLAFFLGKQSQEDPQRAPAVHLGVELPAGQRLDLPNPRSGGLDGVAPPLAISSAGDLIAYTAREDEGPTGL